ncbi:MAG: 16S rRNA (uracil(1498)-N(3))-methyltransferase [Nakamurella sp.]
MSGEAWYLLERPPVVGELLLDGAEGRHAATVRRSRVGERIVVTDGAGAVGAGAVVSVGKSALVVDVDEVHRDPRPDVTVTVVQALPKGERSDLAVDLLTEAGVDAIVPWQAARCVARWEGMKAAKGVAKWRTVARESAKQARRPWIPEVTDLADTSEVVRRIATADLALVLHEAADAPGAALTDVSWPASGEVLLVVGPEGGVGPQEIERFAAAGARAVRLGPQVLRTSTAGAVALGALGVLAGRW